MNAPARVLLVEDDASIRRFVEIALEDLPGIALVQAATLAEADAALAAAPARLVLSDLMLPDGSGTALLQSLVADPARRAGARLVAFSAGISAARRAQLEAMGVDEVLAKPVSLAALVDCVQRALDPAAATPAAAAAPAPATDDDVVQRHFGGDRALFEAYRASCRQQFGVDRARGDAAAAAPDLPALRRLAHSLKTVLLTLGHEPESRQAVALEALAAEGAAARALAAWAPLRAALERLSAAA